MLRTEDEFGREESHKRLDEFLDVLNQDWVPWIVRAFVLGYLHAWAFLLTMMLRFPGYLRAFLSEFHAGLNGPNQGETHH